MQKPARGGLLKANLRRRLTESSVDVSADVVRQEQAANTADSGKRFVVVRWQPDCVHCECEQPEQTSNDSGQAH